MTDQYLTVRPVSSTRFGLDVTTYACLGKELGEGGSSIVVEHSFGNQLPRSESPLVAKLYKETTEGPCPGIAMSEEAMTVVSASPYIIRSYGLFATDLITVEKMIGNFSQYHPKLAKTRHSEDPIDEFIFSQIKKTSIGKFLEKPPPKQCVFYMLMERCQCTLQDLICHRPMQGAEVAFAMDSLLQALGFLHKISIVHRDVKPANVLITDNGTRVVLGDLGSALFTPRDVDMLHWRSGGTHGYVAPESLEKRQCSTKSDIFCAGAVLYLLLFRKHAFLRDTVEATIEATMSCSWPQDPPPGVPSSELVLDMLSVEPTLRPPAKSILRNEWLQCNSDASISLAGMNCWVPTLKAPLGHPACVYAPLTGSKEVAKELKKVGKPKTKDALSSTITSKLPENREEWIYAIEKLQIGQAAKKRKPWKARVPGKERSERFSSMPGHRSLGRLGRIGAGMKRGVSCVRKVFGSGTMVQHFDPIQQ